MLLKKLIIYNFRSYYGMKVFNFSDKLNLILGSNGDGKTTFFEALSWVLTPDYAAKKEDNTFSNESVVSAKMFEELKPGQMGRVLVSIEFSNKFNNTTSSRIIERLLNVSKTSDNRIKFEGGHHEAYISTGGKKGKVLPSLKNVLEGEAAFPSVIKKYHIFKGEEELNIFDDKSTLDSLINLYADIKDITFYQQFAKYAIKESEKVKDGAIEKSNENRSKIAKLEREIGDKEAELQRKRSRLNSATSDYREYDRLIEQYKDDLPAIRRIAELKKEIEEHEKDREGFKKRIHENYSYNLLDDKWILIGFESILEDYNRKVKSFSLSKATIEHEFERKQIEEHEKQKAEKAKNELEKIVWKMNDVDKMKYMLKSHRCAFCGTTAEEGSVTYDFIKQRLNDVIDLLTAKPKDTSLVIKKMFPFSNIDRLLRIGEDLSYENSTQHIDIKGIPSLIQQLKEENEEHRTEMRQCAFEIEEAEKEMAILNAGSKSGLDLIKESEKATDIDSWRDSKEDSANLKKDLELEIPGLESSIEEKRKTLRSLQKKAGAGTLYANYDFFMHLKMAIDNAGASTYTDMLERISQSANIFLAALNVDDFTGVIDIQQINGEVVIKLVDKNQKLITNPNTSLLTTVHISILLAISEITKEHRQVDYPLIFDAPTSSFDEGKDRSFYECLNERVNKQCIVVTKSYLYKDDATNEYVVDEDALNNIDCKKYRIRKLSGFDKLDLTTIDTQVEEL